MYCEDRASSMVFCLFTWHCSSSAAARCPAWKCCKGSIRATWTQAPLLPAPPLKALPEAP